MKAVQRAVDLTPASIDQMGLCTGDSICRPRLRSTLKLSKMRHFPSLACVSAIVLLVILYVFFQQTHRRHNETYFENDFDPGIIPTASPMSSYETSVEEIERIGLPKNLKILMLIIVEEGTNLATYSQALSSMDCYSRRQGYDYKLVEDSEFPDCAQADFMFRRHCITRIFLPNYDYIVFLDGDMAVVNPNRRFEEFIAPDADITFYERFENWEFAAGSYIAKNTNWTSEFLRLFADFEQKLPHSFHGTDNGALHIFIAELMYPDLHEDLKTCWQVYHQSRNYDHLFTYEACVRNIMGFRRKIEGIRIREKGTGWVRDIWLTDSRWSPDRDFMLHALQQQRRISFQPTIKDRANMGSYHLYYYDPFLPNANWTHCESPAFQWPVDPRLIIPVEDVESILRRIKYERERKRWRFTGRVEKFVPQA